MSLHDDVKVALRVTSDKMDPEVDILIAAALADLERAGVRKHLLQEGTMDPYVKMAVVLYCKANFGFDNSDASRFQSAYRQMVKDILNSPTRYAAYMTRGGCPDAVE